jgi:Xaa-Pro aminopeptidase
MCFGVVQAAYSFCPHHVSHYLGMDVHDTALIPRSVPLEPGMVITVEPGKLFMYSIYLFVSN